MADLVFSKTFSDTRLLQCTDWQNNTYVCLTWENNSYSENGDSVATQKYSKITIITPQVTATGWSSSGGVRYNFYVILFTENGKSYTSDIKQYYWNQSNQNLTLSFEINNVIGRWTYFEIWACNSTVSEKDTTYPRLYWFNNNPGVVYVTYEIQNAFPTTIFVGTVNNNFVPGILYEYQNGQWTERTLGVYNNGNWIT